MKIAIDIQTTLGQPTGFGFYVSNLVEALKKVDPNDEFALIRPAGETDFSTPRRFIWDQFTFPRKARKAKVDLLHQPCFSVPFIFHGPSVVTIHDIICILFPENIPFASKMFYSRWMPFSYRKATKFITISNSTKEDIVRVLKIPEEKITVVYNSYDESFTIPTSSAKIQAVLKKYKIPGDYVLHVGTLEPRKNLNFLIDVFSAVLARPENKNLHLVIAGKKGWFYEGLFEKVRERQLENKVIFTGYIDNEDKPALYKGARIFAFPSMYEGFGLPPLEAIASGVPVISSNTSSMPEVIGDAGILISPKDTKKWIEAITRVNTDDELRDKMKEKNKIQAKKFSWDKAARETVEVYRRAVSEYSKNSKS